MAEIVVGEHTGFRRLPPDSEARLRGYSETLHRDGAVCVPKALSADDLRAARELYDWSCANPGQSAQDLKINELGERIFVDTHNVAARNHYREVLQRTTLPAIAAAAYGVDRLWFMGEQIFRKRGADRSAGTFWHQDNIPVDPLGVVGMWITFDRLYPDYSLQIVRESHRGPLFNFHDVYGEGGEPRLHYPDASDMPLLPDIDRDPGRFDILSWAYEPGDVIFFYPSAVHGGGPVPPEGLRRTLSLRFIGPAARHKKLPDRPKTENLGEELSAYLWEGLQEEQPFHMGRHFFKVFDAGEPASAPSRPPPAPHW